jgi:O-antigen ligase
VARGVATVAFIGSCLLLMVAPFEMLRPLVHLPGQNVSNVEATMAVAFVAWGSASAWSRARPVLRTVCTAPWLALLAAAAAAAVLAPVDRLNALHMTARFVLAFGVFALCVNGITTRRRAGSVAVIFLGVAFVCSVLAILEYLRIGPVLRLLQSFRPAVALVGAQVRAGGPFPYPTIASMFFEIAFALGLGLLVVAADSGRWRVVTAIVALLALVMQALVLTFTRSGLLTAGAALAVVAALVTRRKGSGRTLAALALVGGIAAVEIAASRSLEALQLRFTTEGQQAWYRATFDAPRELTLRTGERITVPISVTNSGRLLWHPDGDDPIRLSYHWLEGEGDEVVVWEGLRTTLETPLVPGETRRVDANVRAPAREGDFTLVWDVEQVDRLWFSTEPNAQLFTTRAAVRGPVVALPPQTGGPRTMPAPVERPGRTVLWNAALRLFAERPLFGIGPDNYRLHYGPAAGLIKADPRVHSNNMYLEILVGCGLPGAAALLWLVASIACCAWRAAHAADGLSLGALAAVVAIALHGLTDSFLGFTATYIAMAVCVALLVRISGGLEAHAHRV